MSSERGNSTPSYATPSSVDMEPGATRTDATVHHPDTATTDTAAGPDAGAAAGPDGPVLHVPLPPEVPAPERLSVPGGLSMPGPGPGPMPEPVPVGGGAAASEDAAGEGAGAGPAAVPAAARRGPADPVRTLMHRHRELCEQAVDPLEIAAGLEAHGVTDRTAARFRHRDVFSLAEELYVRVPRAEQSAAELPPREREDTSPYAADRFARLVLPLLPAALCAVTLAALAQAQDASSLLRVVLGALGALAAGAAVRLALPRAARTRTVTFAACWLVGFALFGEVLLREAVLWDAAGAGQFTGSRADSARDVALTLACAVAPAVWGARWFSVRARRMLRGSRGLDEFAAGVRPLLTGTVALFALTLLAAQAVTRLVLGGPQPGPGTPAGTTALGVLLFLALLLSAHGRPRAAAAGLGVACVTALLALAAAPASRLPGPDPALVPLAVCCCAAAALLVYAFRALARASAHHRQTDGR